MRVIPPVTINDARLTSTSSVEVASAAYNAGTTYELNATASVAGTAGTIAEYKSLQAGNIGHTPSSSPTWWIKIGDTYQVYSGAATYALSDYVIDSTAHLVYRSLANGNIGNPLSDTTKWSSQGATNARAMFDMNRSTPTISPDGVPLVFVIAAGVRINSFAALGLIANSITVTGTSGGNSVYSSTLDLNTREVTGFYDFFFEEFSTKPAVVAFDLPPYTDLILTVTISAPAGAVQCGAFVVGMNYYIGEVQYGADSDVMNFSTIERDFDSQINVLTQRRNVPKTIQEISVKRQRVNKIRELRTDLNAIPAVWAGVEDTSNEYFESLLILGIYTRFTIGLGDVNRANVSLQLEEI